MSGPSIPIAVWADEVKYRQEGEEYNQKCGRVAGALTDNQDHYNKFYDILFNQRFLPGGRVQSSVGSVRQTTAFNCFVMPKVPDSLDGIMEVAKQAAKTMQLGGGVGYDFSSIRPKGARIRSLGSQASGPVPFMGIMDAVCKTIASAGHRRGAQMGCLRVDHPDIMEFINSKTNHDNLTQFNISVLVTDKFMEAVKLDSTFDLVFEGRVYDTVRARNLWESILRATWDWAEPGVIYIDRVNQMNNLWYIEDISATNPCLHPDSIVETEYGRMRIADIDRPMRVYSMGENGELVMAHATASWVSKKDAETVVVEVDTGKKLTCTPDHLVWVIDKGWTEAGSLEKGDRVGHLLRTMKSEQYSRVSLNTAPRQWGYEPEHRFVIGDIPEGYDVHHVDGNTFNNSVSNLEVLPHSYHSVVTNTGSDKSSMERDSLGRFTKVKEKKKKQTLSMPEELQSNAVNQFSGRVMSVTEGPKTDVYDMSVAGTHNFIADFMVVHNCGEQPLPPYGACLLGSFNLTKYVEVDSDVPAGYSFNYAQLKQDIPHVVRAMDNVIDETTYPLAEQLKEAVDKRRMGLGVTGLANVLGALGITYGSQNAQDWTYNVLRTITNTAYMSSVELAIEKGPFPLYREDYLDSSFIKKLNLDVQEAISKHGIRNSHLTSIAPTGTISLTANNISSGIEPVFSLEYDRTIQTMDGPRVETVQDYAYREWGIKCPTAAETTVDQHVGMLTASQEWVDSACSKTCNVGDSVGWEEFKDIYMKAYLGGAKGCTTFRASGKRFGILNASASEDVVEEDHEEDEVIIEGGACYIDMDTGMRTCDSI